MRRFLLNMVSLLLLTAIPNCKQAALLLMGLFYLGFMHHIIYLSWASRMMSGDELTTMLT
jgi:hypothetical protein